MATKVKVQKPNAVKTKAEFIKELQGQVEGVELSQKAADEVFKKIFEIIVTAVKKNERFAVPGFGTFALQKRKARWGRNPRDPEQKIKIKASKTIKFKLSSKIKEGL